MSDYMMDAAGSPVECANCSAFIWKSGLDTRKWKDAYFHSEGCRATYLIDANLVLQAQLVEATKYVRRYRAETPLGHQPHMIAAEVDTFLALPTSEVKKL
jgi:hypothetical protein